MMENMKQGTLSRWGNCKKCDGIMLKEGGYDCPKCSMAMLASIDDDGLIDDAVKLNPTKKARCGHISFNYFYCASCKRSGPGKEGSNEFLGLTKKVLAWDVNSLSYNKPKSKPGDALRNRRSLGKRRGYSYDKKRNNFTVMFRGVFLGTVATAEQARHIYMKATTAYQEEHTKKENT